MRFEGRPWHATASRQDSCQSRHVLRSIVTQKMECQRIRWEIRQSTTPTSLRSGCMALGVAKPTIGPPLSLISSHHHTRAGSTRGKDADWRDEDREASIRPLKRPTPPRQGSPAGDLPPSPCRRSLRLVDKRSFNRTDRVKKLFHVLGSLVNLRIQGAHDCPR